MRGSIPSDPAEPMARRTRHRCSERWRNEARLWIDATSSKVRQSGRIVSVAVTIAVGVNTDGRREVLGMAARKATKMREACLDQTEL